MDDMLENQENNVNLDNKFETVEISLQSIEKEIDTAAAPLNEENPSETVLENDKNCDLSDDDISRGRKNYKIDEDDESNVEKSTPLTSSLKKRRVIDSDSDDDLDFQQNEEISPHEKSFSTRTSPSIPEKENDEEDVEIASHFSTVKSRLKALCDSDSSEDEEIHREPETQHHEEVKSTSKAPRKSKRSQAKEEKPVKMTGRDAAKLRTEIQSVSQRMARSANVSLPYHKPKVHTLKEFLTRRPKLASAVQVPSAIPAPLAIKMGPEQLAEIALKLMNREKELKEFYRSDSESDDGDEDYVPQDEKNDESNPLDGENNLQTLHSVDVPQNEEIIENKLTADSEEGVKNPEIEIEKEITSNDKEELANVDTGEANFNDGERINKDISTEQENEINPSEIETEITSETTELEDIASNETDNISLLEAQNQTDSLNELNEPVIVSDDQIEGKKLSMIDILKANLPNINPKLSGGPNDVIDLETGVTKPNEICKLKERFKKHTTNAEKHKASVRLNVLSVTRGEVHKETLAMSVHDEDELHKIEEKPLVRYKKLRNDLENQIALKRTEYWNQRNNEMLENKGETEDDSEEKKSDYEKDVDPLLDLDEEEEDLTETDEETDEEECVEDDVNLEDKTRRKSAFVDEEAEESENEENDESDTQASTQETETEPKEKNKHRRIINKFGDDSDEENSESEANKSIDRLDSTLGELSSISLPQHMFNRTPSRPQIDYNATLSCLTPISFVNCAPSLNSETKSLKESPLISPMNFDPSPYKKLPFQSSLQKKLTFSEDSQEVSRNLAGISPTYDVSTTQSGTFPPNTQDILNVCSGTFTESQLVNTQEDNDSQISEKKQDDSSRDDLLITQILDEDEIEQNKLIANKENQMAKEIQGGGVLDSDEEDGGVLGVKKRRNRGKLALSDDESDSDNEHDKEEIDLNDGFESEEDVAPENICYDSEENEIELEQTEADGPSASYKPSDFVEQEAELSESEWGSEDEDEKGLDAFEEEFCDTENYDENKIRKDIERLHMRRLLDDDNREVKLLQEMLLEDGELHGTGRQRQFKWKNIDAMDEENARPGEDDEPLLDEEETEEEFRKKRYQRELFLKSNSQKRLENDDDDEDENIVNNHLFKISQRLIKKTTAISSIKAKENTMAINLNQQFNIFSKRGSFLSKDAAVLKGLEKITKEQTSVSIATTKKSKNFLFQTVESKQNSVEEKKRKAADTTSNVNKKFRLNSGTNKTSVNKKSLYTNNNW